MPFLLFWHPRARGAVPEPEDEAQPTPPEGGGMVSRHFREVRRQRMRRDEDDLFMMLATVMPILAGEVHGEL